MIERYSPEIDYLAPQVFEAFAFHQSVRAGDTLYLSGIAPLRGDLENLELIGKDDMVAQLGYILAVVDGCLEAAGLQRRHLVAWTFHTTDIDALADVLPEHLGPWVGAHRPTSTTVEVRKLLHPDQLLEITAIAVASD
ncbi:RidA family protein [Pseudomonas sp. ABC1]|uniref:RidA family protein n=1 Tax=Pseudomonas sp. ABC1 TaxID=2748080 RepID=UPI0015C3DC4F|nr:RidA family protein [Pseudomonas sp. ABC1]QLF91927.1 RidA family protein [Pseudomonas sp. ABC1]